MKTCIKCGIEKDISEFHFRTDSGKYRNECYDCGKEYNKIKYKNNREEIRKATRARNKENPIPNRERVKKWKEENPDKVRINHKRYYARHKKEILERRRDTHRKYRKNNPDKVRKWRLKDNSKLSTRVSNNLRSRLRTALKGNYKSGSAVRDLGCAIDEFRKYIEGLWTPGMSWENYGKFGWHIDHIVPLSSFDLTDREQFLKACHYTNLQPLWAEDNLKKGNKIIK